MSKAIANIHGVGNLLPPIRLNFIINVQADKYRPLFKLYSHCGRIEKQTEFARYNLDRV